MRRSVVLAAVLLGWGGHAAAQEAPAEVSAPSGAPDDLVGTYVVRGRSLQTAQAPQFEGRLVVKPGLNGGLAVSGALGPFGAVDLRVPRGTRTLVLKPGEARAEDGLIDALFRRVIAPDPLPVQVPFKPRRPGTQLELQAHPEGAGFRGTIVEDGDVVAEVQLRRVDRAVAIFDRYDDAFGIYARRTAELYRQKGWKAQHVGIDTWDEVLALLHQAEADGFPYTRLVIVSHAGWDGPLLANPVQISPWGEATERWGELLDAFRRGTAPNAKMYFSGCHTGGSNRYEGDDDRRWAVEVGRGTGRFAAGPAGSTSTEWTAHMARAVLEGEGNVKQETWAATRDGVVRVAPLRPFAQGRATPWTAYVPAPATSHADADPDSTPAPAPLAGASALGALGD